VRWRAGFSTPSNAVFSKTRLLLPVVLRRVWKTDRDMDKDTDTNA